MPSKLYSSYQVQLPLQKPLFSSFSQGKDEDAFAIETAYGCIGNIPADTVFRIVDAFDDIKTVLVYPKNFVNEDGRTVWFADVEVYY
mgnify:CR=1 FL=1